MMGFIALPGSGWITKDVSSGYCTTKQEAIHEESAVKNDIKMGIGTEMVKLLLDKPDHVSLQYVANNVKTTPLSVLTLTFCAQFQFQSCFFHVDPARIWHYTQ